MAAHPGLSGFAGLALWALAACQAHAESTDHTMPVSAAVPRYCDVGADASGTVTDGLLDFGRHFSMTGGSLRAQTAMRLRCNDPTMSPAVSFDTGAHAASGSDQRRLAGPNGSLLAYQLLRGPAIDAPAWDEQPYSVALAPDGTGTFPVFGYIPSFPDTLSDGQYTDTVVIRVDY